jgi:hypothetical protein
VTPRATAVGACALLAAAVLSGCGSAPAAAPESSVPLAAATVGGAIALATLPMGLPSSPQETFWELFAREGVAWVLITPPGVATNGGVVAAGGGSHAVLTGVLGSADLRFSPVAETVDLGASWTTGVLGSGLVRAPDALATSQDGRHLALLSGSPGSIVTSAAGPSVWRTLATSTTVANDTAKVCDLDSLRAVALAADGAALVAGHCRRGADLPVAVLEGGRWRMVAANVTLGDHAQVLRLDEGPNGVAALLEVARGSRRSLLVAWARSPESTWATTPALPVGGDTVVSTTLGASHAAVAVLASRTGVRTAFATSAHGGWLELPALPGGTVDVVTLPKGTPQALAVSGATLRVLTLVGDAWRTTQRRVVPIELGSSG